MSDLVIKILEEFSRFLNYSILMPIFTIDIRIYFAYLLLLEATKYPFLKFHYGRNEISFEENKKRRKTEDKRYEHCNDESSKNITWSVNSSNYPTSRHHNGNNNEEIGKINQLFILCFVSSDKSCNGDGHPDYSVIRGERTGWKEVVKKRLCYFISVYDFYLRSIFDEKILKENIRGNTNEARKEDKNCSLLVFKLFFYYSSEVKDDEEDGVNNQENIGSDRGKGSDSWVVLSEFHSLQEEMVSSLRFYEMEFH
jgi:hypothetical protein